MKISTRSRYGVRSLCELAKHKGKRPLTVQAIASRQHISKKYLDSILATLQKTKLINARRGILGGHELTKKPSEIRMLEVFEALEGPLELVPCLNGNFQCELSESCEARIVWERVQAAIKAALRNITLDDLVHQQIQEDPIPLICLGTGRQKNAVLG